MVNMIMEKVTIRKRVSLAILVLGLALFSLAACLGPTETVTYEDLFSATPSFTPSPTIQWFPVTATPEMAVSATNTPNPEANPRYGSLLFSDATGTSVNWPASTDFNGSIIVAEGSVALTVNAIKGSLSVQRKNTTLTDYYFETVMTVGLCKNDDQMGVLFRAMGSQSYYRFMINCQGQIALQQVSGGAPTMINDWSPTNQTQPGLDTPVKIGIWVHGKTIRIYLNDQLQYVAQNSTFYNGDIGFFAKSGGDTTVSVVFSEINVYEIQY
jgi:hypothetical protein